MSDELLFDSERQERRARRKTRLIPLIVLAAVIVLAVVVALVIRKSKAELHNAGENTPYPFTWYNESDGRMVLELPHEDAPEYRWTLVNGEALEILSADRREKEKGGKTCFTLTPTAEGRTVMELALLREAQTPAATAAPATASVESDEEDDAEPEPDDIVYRTTLQLENAESEGRLVCTLLSVSGYRLQPQVRGGEGSGNPYEVRSNEQRELVITVQVSGLERDWVCELVSGEDSVVVEGIMNTGEATQLYLKSGEVPGESELVMRSETANAELRFRCRTETDGALLLIERQENYGEKPEIPSQNEGREAVATAAQGEKHEENWEGVPETFGDEPEQTDTAPAESTSPEPAETTPETTSEGGER